MNSVYTRATNPKSRQVHLCYANIGESVTDMMSLSWMSLAFPC